MTSQWKWNTVNLWVSDEDVSREVKRAELFVLDATESVYHFFGAGSRKYSLKGFVIGAADRSSLETDSINNTSGTLSTPWGSVSGLRINTLKFTMKKYSGAVIDGTTYVATETPIYDYDMELITA